MMEIRESTCIPGMLVDSAGRIKLPVTYAAMPRGGMRKYETSWVRGVPTKADKKAKHVYLGLVYRNKNYKVHRLVCTAFHGAPPHKDAVVIHKDEDATNNSAANLKWGTQKENLNAPGFKSYCRSRTGDNSPVRKGRHKE